MKKFFGIFTLLCLFVKIFPQSQTLKSEETIQAEFDSNSTSKNTENFQNQENPPASESGKNPVISKIQFSGLKKTRDSYIQSKVQKFIGEELSENELHNIETAIQLEGLFNDIQISTERISDSDVQINVSVKEKITFIPLPFAMYSSSGFSAGCAVMDSNAFGVKDIFVVGGLFSKKQKMGVLLFKKQPGENWIPGIGLSFMGSKSTPEYKNFENDLVLKHNAVSFKLGVALSEKIGEHFSFTNGYMIKTSSTNDDSDFVNLSPESYKIAGFSFSLDYSKSDWNGVFMSTNSASVSTEFGITNSKDSDFRYPMGFSFAIGEQHPIFTTRLRMSQRISGYYGRNNLISEFKSQGAGSVSILTSNFSTERIIGGNTGFEFAIAKFSLGMISIYANYQLVYAQDCTATGSGGDYEFLHGPNGGVRLYLAKIAFPALAAGVSYNVTKNYWQFSASFGVSL